MKIVTSQMRLYIKLVVSVALNQQNVNLTSAASLFFVLLPLCFHFRRRRLISQQHFLRSRSTLCLSLSHTQTVLAKVAVKLNFLFVCLMYIR